MSSSGRGDFCLGPCSIAQSYPEGSPTTTASNEGLTRSWSPIFRKAGGNLNPRSIQPAPSLHYRKARTQMLVSSTLRPFSPSTSALSRTTLASSAVAPPCEREAQQAVTETVSLTTESQSVGKGLLPAATVSDRSDPEPTTGVGASCQGMDAIQGRSLQESRTGGLFVDLGPPSSGLAVANQGPELKPVWLSDPAVAAIVNPGVSPSASPTAEAMTALGLSLQEAMGLQASGEAEGHKSGVAGRTATGEFFYVCVRDQKPGEEYGEPQQFRLFFGNAGEIKERPVLETTSPSRSSFVLESDDGLQVDPFQATLKYRPQQPGCQVQFGMQKPAQVVKLWDLS